MVFDIQVSTYWENHKVFYIQISQFYGFLYIQVSTPYENCMFFCIQISQFYGFWYSKSILFKKLMFFDIQVSTLFENTTL